MENLPRHSVFKYLVAVSIAAGCGLVRPGPRLLRLPETLVSELVDSMSDSDERGWPKSAKKNVLLLLADDPRTAVRARVAESASVLLPELRHDATRLVRALAGDPSARVRAAAARGFGSLLEQTNPVARVEIVCEWTMSKQASERETVARGLCSPFPLMFADLVIEQLSLDRDATVRLWAIRAAARHASEDPAGYAKIAAQLVSDDRRLVRRAARRVLKLIAASSPAPGRGRGLGIVHAV